VPFPITVPAAKNPGHRKHTGRNQAIVNTRFQRRLFQRKLGGTLESALNRLQRFLHSKQSQATLPRLTQTDYLVCKPPVPINSCKQTSSHKSLIEVSAVCSQAHAHNLQL
jgi:hypothetical protein